LLIALGRRPDIEGIGLDEAGVRYSPAGVPTEPTMQTDVAHIYAVGDLVGPYVFSPMAGLQARTAVDHVLGRPAQMTQDHAWCTLTHPELARTGMTEAEAAAALGDAYTVYTAPMTAADRSVVDDRPDGGAKVICGPDDRILGASTLGERAGELLGPLQLLRTLGEPIGRPTEAIHPHPSYSEVLTALPPPLGGRAGLAG
jgi:pyruvate/2-oxoglutarate dehydrogenase complex dihydrolipoamide dehydrogenase (E3) component